MKSPKLFETCTGKATGREVQVRTAQQPRLRPLLAPALGFKFGRHALPQRSTLPSQRLSQASAREAWCWFSKSTCFFDWSSTAWGALRNTDSTCTALPPLTSLFLSTAWPTNTTLYLYVEEATSVFFPLPSFWPKKSQMWIQEHRTRGTCCCYCLCICAAFIDFTCSRHTNRKAAWRIKGQDGADIKAPPMVHWKYWNLVLTSDMQTKQSKEPGEQLMLKDWITKPDVIDLQALRATEAMTGRDLWRLSSPISRSEQDQHQHEIRSCLVTWS